MRVYYAKPAGKILSEHGKDSKHVIWGDWLDVEDDPSDPATYKVSWKTQSSDGRPAAPKPLRVKKSDCQPDPLLEMIFLDVGQGDSCILGVPVGGEQKIIIVDAGAGDNTYRFLKWRFRNVDDSARFDAAVITHPDSDHYAGFQDILEHAEVKIGTVYHNGLVDLGYQLKDDRLGRRSDGMCLDLYQDRASIGNLLSGVAAAEEGSYTRLLRTAFDDERRFGDMRMASTLHGEEVDGKTYLPGFSPTDGSEATIEILGPVPEEIANGALALRELGDTPRSRSFDVGKTKNGHSVILKLCYGGLRVLFGGDLNRSSEDYLLRHYGGVGDQGPLSAAVHGARARLAADILKCCHHGSADVTDEFLQAVNPFGIVVSSGDQESHVHPRPEVLGLLGKQGRGDRPIILCTEILRSTPEKLSLTSEERKKHGALLAAFASAAEGAARKAAEAKIEAFWKDKLQRLVTVYGAINLRTDGKKLIVAFRKEKGGSGSPWQLYEYELVDGEWKGSERRSRQRKPH